MSTTTEPRARRALVAMATTVAASAAGVVAVAWAATTPVPSPTPAAGPGRIATIERNDTAVLMRRITVARAALDRVRHDIAALARQTAQLPRASTVGGTASGGATTPTAVYVPPATPAIAVPAPAPAAPPAHATTGASGVVH